jgi:hypothetical protein
VPVEVLPRVVRHRGGRLNVQLTKYEMNRRGFTTVSLSRASTVSRWVVSRGLNGHPIDNSSLRKIAEALAAAPVVDGGLLLAPGQLEEK